MQSQTLIQPNVDTTFPSHYSIVFLDKCKETQCDLVLITYLLTIQLNSIRKVWKIGRVMEESKEQLSTHKS